MHERTDNTGEKDVVQQSLDIFESLLAKELPHKRGDRVAHFLAFTYFRGYYIREGLSGDAMREAAMKRANESWPAFFSIAEDLLSIIAGTKALYQKQQ